MVYEISYSAKDLILYAIALGMGSTKKDADEMKYLCEAHDKFSAVPTFFLAFIFWADKKPNKSDMNGIPAFPPPLMAKEEVIPRKFLRAESEGLHADKNLANFPVIHAWQSIIWHEQGPKVTQAPQGRGERHDSQITVNIDIMTISVQPKSIGTFVTTQTQIGTLPGHRGRRRSQCTMQSTTLVMGISPDKVIPFDAGIPLLSRVKESTFFNTKPVNNELHPPIYQWCYQTTQSQALLYRLASGDSNHIHVDTSASDLLRSDTKAPILHGLFTLALAFRAINKLVNSSSGSAKADDLDVVFRKLEGKFTQPAFVGDCLCVKIWKDDTTMTQEDSYSTNRPSKRFAFVVCNQKTGKTLVDCGCAEVEVTTSSSSRKTSRL